VADRAPLGVPEHTAANLRRSILIAMPVGLALLVVCAALGHAVAGLLLLVGLAIGAGNTLLVQRSVVTYASAAGHGRKQRFVGGALARLGLITAISVVAMLLVRPDGLGLLGGVAVFQMLMLAGATAPLIKELRKV
jgi:hypothetical protein